MKYIQLLSITFTVVMMTSNLSQAIETAEAASGPMLSDLRAGNNLSELSKLTISRDVLAQNKSFYATEESKDNKSNIENMLYLGESIAAFKKADGDKSVSCGLYSLKATAAESNLKLSKDDSYELGSAPKFNEEKKTATIYFYKQQTATTAEVEGIAVTCVNVDSKTQVSAIETALAGGVKIQR